MICVLYTAWSYQLCLPKHRLTPPGGVQYTQEWTHLAIAQQWMIWDTTHYSTPSHLRKHSQLMEKNTEAAASAAATVTVPAAIAASASIAASAAPPWHQQQKQQRRPQFFFLFRAKAHFVQKLNIQFFSIWSSYTVYSYIYLSLSLSLPLSLFLTLWMVYLFIFV